MFLHVGETLLHVKETSLHVGETLLQVKETFLHVGEMFLQVGKVFPKIARMNGGIMDFENEISELMAKMSVDDKIKVLSQIGNQYGAVPSLDFSGIVPQDVPRGGEDNWTSGAPKRDENGVITDGKYHPVAFPSNSALAMRPCAPSRRRVCP